MSEIEKIREDAATAVDLALCIINTTKGEEGSAALYRERLCEELELTTPLENIAREAIKMAALIKNEEVDAWHEVAMRIYEMVYEVK